MFPYGFDETFEKEILCSDLELLTDYYIDQIISDKSWLDIVIEKARKNNVSVEKQIQLDAGYMARKELTNRSQNSKNAEKSE